MRKQFYFFVAVLMFVFPQSLFAEVYKWTDANGKVHYSNQKPDSQKKVENVTADLKKVNTDSSQQEQQKMSGIFRKENSYDRAAQEQQAQPNPAQQERCEEARSILAKLNHRVVVTDEDGKDTHMTEVERREKAKKLRDQIAEYCAE